MQSTASVSGQEKGVESGRVSGVITVALTMKKKQSLSTHSFIKCPTKNYFNSTNAHDSRKRFTLVFGNYAKCLINLESDKLSYNCPTAPSKKRNPVSDHVRIQLLLQTSTHILSHDFRLKLCNCTGTASHFFSDNFFRKCASQKIRQGTK